MQDTFLLKDFESIVSLYNLIFSFDGQKSMRVK